MAIGDKLNSYVNPRSVENRIKKAERRINRLYSHRLMKGSTETGTRSGTGRDPVGPNPISTRLPTPAPETITVNITHSYTSDAVWQPQAEVVVDTTALGHVEGFAGYRYEVTDPSGNISVYGGSYDGDTGTVTPLRVPLRPNLESESDNRWQVRIKTLSYTRGESVWGDAKTFSVTEPSTLPPTPTGLTTSALPGGVLVSWDEPTVRNYSHSEVWIGNLSATVVVEKHARTPHQLIWDFDTMSPAVYGSVYVRHIDTAGVAGNFEQATANPGKVGTVQIEDEAITGALLNTAISYSGTLSLTGLGKVTAGGGAVVLGAGGIDINPSATFGEDNIYFYDDAGTEIGQLFSAGTIPGASVRLSVSDGKLYLAGVDGVVINSSGGTTELNGDFITIGAGGSNPVSVQSLLSCSQNATFEPSSASNVPLIAKGTTSQTADIFQVKTSGNVGVFGIGPAGEIRTANYLSSGNADTIIDYELPVYDLSANLIGYINVFRPL